MFSKSSSRFVVYTALAGNLIIALSKIEGIHSLVDCVNELLLYGLHRAGTPPDRTHSFGHGRVVFLKLHRHVTQPGLPRKIFTENYCVK